MVAPAMMRPQISGSDKRPERIKTNTTARASSFIIGWRELRARTPVLSARSATYSAAAPKSSPSGRTAATKRAAIANRDR